MPHGTGQVNLHAINGVGLFQFLYCLSKFVLGLLYAASHMMVPEELFLLYLCLGSKYRVLAFTLNIDSGHT